VKRARARARNLSQTLGHGLGLGLVHEIGDKRLLFAERGEDDGGVVAAKAEGVREGHIDV
jgi:hypothetical protein